MVWVGPGCVKYCFDTSALIGAWIRKYPPDVVPGFWDRLDELILEGRLLWNVEVIAELAKQKDDLHKWVKDHSTACRPLDQEVQQKTKDILAQYPLMLNTKGSRPTADPFIVAQAVVSKAVLVTEEGPSPRASRLHIPDVCKGLGIKCIDLLTFMRDEKIRLTLA